MVEPAKQSPSRCAIKATVETCVQRSKQALTTHGKLRIIESFVGLAGSQTCFEASNTDCLHPLNTFVKRRERKRGAGEQDMETASQRAKHLPSKQSLKGDKGDVVAFAGALSFSWPSQANEQSMGSRSGRWLPKAPPLHWRKPLGVLVCISSEKTGALSNVWFSC